jgi:hypothetical protein
MQITYAGRTEERVNLLLVGVALNTLLGIVHDSYYVLHLLVHTSEDVCLVELTCYDSDSAAGSDKTENETFDFGKTNEIEVVFMVSGNVSLSF